MLVFQLNDNDWAFGASYGQAVDGYCSDVNLPWDEALGDVSQVDDEELDKLMICDDNGEPVRSFRKEIEKHVADGKISGFLASSEF